MHGLRAYCKVVVSVVKDTPPLTSLNLYIEDSKKNKKKTETLSLYMLQYLFNNIANLVSLKINRSIDVEI